MRKLWVLFGALFLLASFAAAQTNTPTPSNTPTPTPTFTPSNTPTAVAAPGPYAPLTIPSGVATSSSLLLGAASYSVTILAPATLDGTTKIEVSDTAAGTVWREYQIAGVDVAVAAGKGTTFLITGVVQLRIKQSTTAAADRTFVATAVVTAR